MAFCPGESFEPVLDERDTMPGPAQLHGRQLDAARILGRLHAVTPAALGLDDEPEVSLDEEVRRWERIFDTVTEDLRPGHAECSAALLDRLPEVVPSVVVHGEYRLGNMLASDDRVVAVIDWELWARQDPRVDLSWFLQYADAEGQPSAIRPTPHGMPSRAELLRTYEAAVGAPVADLAWFDAHARFKMAAIAAITCKHNRRRADPDPAQEARVPLVRELIEQAHDLLGRARSPLRPEVATAQMESIDRWDA
jgi:aminoglycoside phosphotransferase (APT) family kinase protein